MNTGLTASQKRYVQIKRFLDFALSLGACILLSPILLLLCIAIKLDNRGPVLFKQKRVWSKRRFAGTDWLGTI